MESLHLTFGAIDMIQTPDGDYVFLEVNPSKQWLWLDDMLGFGISDTIAEWLAGAELR
jgi:glutathione synthase/RimK-type ligase-like ATP-grasp enzyme